MKIKKISKTTSWIERFRRHNNGFSKISGESSAFNTEICSNWLFNIWTSHKSGYSDDIYNADEAGILFKLTPDKILHFKGKKCSDGKLF
ncbi:unnamed protein product [Macrosiphum euphorbiae]|uniref:Uncharacterized protein n=1 Tax=Macrosiphum euphorbiae TaxID=13131 RepID=A0AAV0XUE5_9HEMI|nr:unnamed protein product [Macrosiphum euphorbiae]